jgi:Delta7-sterol 5-desaturase
MNYTNYEWWQVVLASSLRYLFFAGMAYLIFYIWKRNEFIRFKIQQVFPAKKAVNREIFYSLMTLVIFASVVYLTMFSSLREHTKLYSNIHDYSLGYFILTIPLVIFLHDTYFYWIHRFMHWKKVFRFVHKVHHQSHNPTPLAAFSFHPLEAVLEIAILPIIVFLIPVHPTVIAVFSLYNLLTNISGHLGFEFMPARFVRNRVLKHFNTSTHHNMHHHYGRGNYGLYFSFWDRILKTNHERYEEEFIRVSRNAELKRRISK